MFATLNGLPTFISSLLKFLFYSILNNHKKNIYLKRLMGFIYAFLGKSSSYRPKIND